MTNAKSALVVAALMAFGAVNAAAQVRAGLSEVNLNGNITAVSAEDQDTETIMQVELRYGYFVTPPVQFGVQLAAAKFEDFDAFGVVGVFGAYHFGSPGSMTVPYVGAQVGTGFGRDDNPSTFGGFAGLKHFLGPAGAISPELFVMRTSSDDFSYTSFGLRVGISVFFGGR